MHKEAETWLSETAKRYSLYRRHCVDLGGRRVNGCVARHFEPVTWKAVDIVDGKGVDVVADITNWTPDRTYGLVLCTEVLEHLEDIEGVIRTAWAACDRLGDFLLTAATDPRLPHSWTGARLVPVDQWYENVDVVHLEEILRRYFRDVAVTVDRKHGDVYAHSSQPREVAR